MLRKTNTEHTVSYFGLAIIAVMLALEVFSMARDSVDLKAANCGRARLMLRISAFRKKLFDASEPSLLELFELYEAASAALEHFRRSHDNQAAMLVLEYETCCREIEADVCRDLAY